MTILEAGLKSSVYEAARSYLLAGARTLPVKDKKPNLKGELWRQWMNHRPSMATLDYWEKEGLLTGVAVICGKVSRNLVVLDFDNFLAMDEFTAEFPHLEDTYMVVSGSRRGAHFYYYVDALPKSLTAPFELRAHGCYVVAPPSIHSSGLNYIVANQRDPMRLHHMGDVVRWMKAKTERPAPEKMLPAPKPPTARPVARTGKWMPPDQFLEYRREQYRKGALNEQLAYISSVIGERNKSLLKTAWRLGELIGGGVLDRARVEQELLQAALRVGLEEAESVRTIKSGIDSGLLTPRGFPF